ncbi:sensor histidine kinase [Paraglaciecola arctica]|uniref:sensor histidine kinase n=1 Tax=Paraglaciecola arctica TaxID=1128911 RepID=UPI001C06CDE7|nr:histidine kinase [Paraglaciecola arctica]
MKKHTSLRKHLVSNVLLVMVIQLILLVFVWQTMSNPNLWISGLLIIGNAVILWVVVNALKPISEVLHALDIGVNSFNDKDFSITIEKQQYTEFSSIINIYNDLAKIMRDERMAIYQRELLLDTVIQSTPVALILTDNHDHIVYSNHAAKTLLNQKKSLEGMSFVDIYQHMPQALMEATANKQDGLVTEKLNDETIVYHLNYQAFTLNKQQHNLYLYKNLTSDMSRKESEIWKQVIRLISHELNNSLAPISSLTNSAKKIIVSGDNLHMLPDMLDTISRRSAHLHQFIEQYAHFARLPKPHKIQVELRPFIQTISQLCAVETVTRFEADNLFCDPAQIEQVLINLIKNAKESGSALNGVLLEIYQSSQHLTFAVSDQGKGMTEQQLLQAILPFYTTKSKGTGVGLALCNEIVIAHGGKLKLENQKQGGLKVAFTLALATKSQA